MYKQRQLASASALALVVSALSVATVSAQTASNSPTGPTSSSRADSAKQTAVSEVIVTASRRSESVQKAALAVTAITGSQLQERDLQNLNDIVAAAPGVISTGEGSINKPVIRGIETSQTTSTVGTEHSVAVYLDDLPLNTSSDILQDVAPYDLARVEVLRGPQGTLFGSGSLSGAIRYITNKPDLSGYHASLDIDGGVMEGGGKLGSIGAMVNVPINDRLAARFVAFSRDDDGWVDDIGTGRKHSNNERDSVYRGELLWRPTDRFSAILTLNDNSNKTGDSPLYDAALGKNISDSPRPWDTIAKLYSVSLSMSYDFNWATLTSSTTYGDNPTRFYGLNLFAIIPGLPIFYDNQFKTETIQQEFRLVSPSTGRLSWTAGLYFLNQIETGGSQLYVPTSFAQGLDITGLPTNINQGATFSSSPSRNDNREIAGYGEASYKIIDTLKLILGGRLTDSRYDTSSSPSLSDSGFYLAALTGGHVDVSAPLLPATSSTTGDNLTFTPKVELQWQPTNDLNLYALADEGFRRPQPNGLAAVTNGGRSLINPSDPAVIPAVAGGDTIWNYELGAKIAWLDHRLITNFAAYFIDWKNLQIPLVRQSDQITYDGNAGTAHSYGLESEVTARLFEGLDLGGSLTLSHAAIASISATDALISGAVKGARLTTPNISGDVYGKYSWHPFGSDIYLRVDYFVRGSFPNSFPNTPGAPTLSPGYATIPSSGYGNLSLGWNRGNVGAVLYADNFTNDQTVIFINPPTVAAGRYGTRRPRVVGVKLSYQY